MLTITSYKDKKHLALAHKIEDSSVEIPLYSFYKKNNQKYIIEDELTRYSECICCKKKCDIMDPLLHDWESLK